MAVKPVLSTLPAHVNDFDHFAFSSSLPAYQDDWVTIQRYMSRWVYKKGFDGMMTLSDSSTIQQIAKTPDTTSMPTVVGQHF